MNTNYDDIKYDAFISYRHTSPDLEIAEKLHKLLETAKTPKGFKKIERVFRDRDELPTSSNLADSILEALKNSRYLIVICSPRTPLSQWVIKEIETFRELHGNDRILALLIEGEPQESFPKELVRFEDVEIEPLAADIRGKDLKAMTKNLKVELLRLLAPIYGCNFDDLKQRHKARKMRRIATVLGCVTVFSLLFGSYSLRQALLLQDKTEKLEKSEIQLVKTNDDLTVTNDNLESANIQLETQNETLENQMNEILIGQSKYIAKEALSLSNVGDSRTAILIANEALPNDFNNMNRPYVPEAEFALFNAINPYKYGNDFYGDFYAHHSDGVKSMSLNYEGNYVVTQSNDGYLYVWDIETQEVLHKEKTLEYSGTSAMEFIPESTELIYLGENGLQNIDFLTGEVLWNNGLELINFSVSVEQGILIGQTYNKIYVCDTLTGKVLETKDIELSLGDSSFDELGNRFVCKDDAHTIYVFDINKNSETILNQVLVTETLYDGFVYYTISSDGSTLAVSSNDYSNSSSYKVGKGELKIFDLDSNNELLTITSDTESFMELMFNNGRDKILHWSSDTLIHSYNLDSKEEYPTMAHGEAITQMKGSIDGSLLMASSYDNTIRYFEVASGLEYEFARFSVPGGVDDFDINGDTLVTMDIFQEDLIVWRSKEGLSVNRYNYETSIDKGFYIGDDYCITLSYDGEVSLWNTKNQKHVKVLKDSISSLLGSYIKDENKFLLIDDYGLASIYDASTFVLIKEVQLDKHSFYSTKISENLGYIAYVNDDYSAVFVYDQALELIQKLPIDDYVSEIYFSEDEQYISLHTNDNTFIHSLSGLEGKIKLPSSDYISFSSISDFIALGQDDKLLVYSFEKPNEIVAEIAFNSIVSAVKFNPNNEEVLLGLVDESLYVYNIKEESKELIDDNLIGTIDSIMFTDTLCLVDLSYTGIMQFRDINNYAQTGYIRGYLDISPNEDAFIFKDGKSLLQGPKLTTQELIELGKTITHNRVLSEAEVKAYSITR